jgi:predicted MPP superfamily phosphohydrolase
MGVLGTLARTAGGVVAAGAAVFAYASFYERRRFTLREVTVPVLPAGSDPIRVLHLSDMHMAPWQHKKQRWVRELAALQPDLVVDTGDNTGHEQGIAAVEETLEAFRGVPGVFVHGSNDYYGPTPKNPFKYFTANTHAVQRQPDLDLPRLERLYASLGWVDLNNAAGAIEVNGTLLEFFGVDDPHRDFDHLEALPGALDALREDGDAYQGSSAAPVVSVGVAHAPYRRVLDSFVTNGARMIFAGHTHGGQVCVPGYGALVTNCDIPRRQVKGLSVWPHADRAAYLHVSAGLGTSIYSPVRFACFPEATLLTLTAV